MTPFDAINHAFSTVATGGFSTKNASIMHYDSNLIYIIIMIFMAVSSMHFGVIYAIFAQRSFKPLKHSVTRYYLTVIAVIALIITVSSINPIISVLGVIIKICSVNIRKEAFCKSRGVIDCFLTVNNVAFNHTALCIFLCFILSWRQKFFIVCVFDKFYRFCLCFF